jgi:hypothetical protein
MFLNQDFKDYGISLFLGKGLDLVGGYLQLGFESGFTRFLGLLKGRIAFALP